MKSYRPVRSPEDLRAALPDLRGCAVYELDVDEAAGAEVAGAIFLGCSMRDPLEQRKLELRGARFFPRFEGLPYNPYRSSLYTWRELLADDRDLRIYQHMLECGGNHPELTEALARRLHDHSIDVALSEFLSGRVCGPFERQTESPQDAVREAGSHNVVGVMGGHGLLRTDPIYLQVARLGLLLCEAGYLVATGGGPGVMEAANLGAYLRPHGLAAVDEAVRILADAPHFSDTAYGERALQVVEHFPSDQASLAIPTWFYGHEPSNLFGSHIAKYFSNSLREDGLLALATHGVVYAPGSAGTTQEVFMDAAQNHYGTFDFYSPMVFMGVERYTRSTSIYPLVQQLAAGREYGKMLYLSDEPHEIVAFLRSHPPVPCVR